MLSNFTGVTENGKVHYDAVLTPVSVLLLLLLLLFLLLLGVTAAAAAH